LPVHILQGSFRRPLSPHVQAGHGPPDDHALDLRGALKDREDLRARVESSAYPVTGLTCGAPTGRTATRRGLHEMSLGQPAAEPA